MKDVLMAVKWGIGYKDLYYGKYLNDFRNKCYN